MPTHAIAISYTITQCNACCKCENDSRYSHSYLEPWWGRMATLRQADEGGSLRTERVQFQVDKFQQLSTIQGLICIVLDVGVPKVVSAFRIIKGPHLRGES